MDPLSAFSAYSTETLGILKGVRDKIMTLMPGVIEELDTKANMLAYLLQPGYKGTVFTLMPVKTHITVGFYNGANLPDPHGLLTGAGKVHKHVKLYSVEQLNSVEFTQLLRSAVQAAEERLSSPKDVKNV